jgi:dCMP deaminase
LARTAVENSDTHNAGAQHTFASVDALIDFVTLRWRERWVTTDIWDDAVVDALLRRPFFLFVSVDAPVSVRWKRFTDRCAANSLPPPTLEEFVLRNDAHLFTPRTGLSALFQRAQLKLLNSTPSIASLRAAVHALDLTNEARLRPSWDQYFMRLADLAAHRSNCMKRRVGCVVVREKRVISTGYNGTPRGMVNCNEGGCKSFPSASPLIVLTRQARAATMPQRAASTCRPVYASTPRRMRSSRLAATASARRPSCTATRARV